MTKSRSKSRQGPTSVQTKQPAGRSGNRSGSYAGWQSSAACWWFVVLLTGGSLAAATQVENRDSFCVLPHPTGERVLPAIACRPGRSGIGAHSQPGRLHPMSQRSRNCFGRLQAISSVAAPDLVHYLTKNYHDPAVHLPFPIGDDHCLKCHSDVSSQLLLCKNFSNRTAFSAPVAGLAPDSAATCTECHRGRDPAARQTLRSCRKQQRGPFASAAMHSPADGNAVAVVNR